MELEAMKKALKTLTMERTIVEEDGRQRRLRQQQREGVEALKNDAHNLLEPKHVPSVTFE